MLVETIRVLIDKIITTVVDVATKIDYDKNWLMKQKQYYKIST